MKHIVFPEGIIMETSVNSIKNVLLGEVEPYSLLSLIPDLAQTVGCQQNHPGHHLDVFAHTLEVIRLLPKDFTLRLTALLHDIGKPEAKTIGKDGFDHFWGHEKIGIQKAALILGRLDINKEQKDTICELIRLHDTPIANDRIEMESAIEQYGFVFIHQLLILQRADLFAHASGYCACKLPKWEEINKLFTTLITDDARSLLIKWENQSN